MVPDISLDHMLPETTALEAGIVSWSPPNSNWNPWIGANIDEGQILLFIFLSWTAFKKKMHSPRIALWSLWANGFSMKQTVQSRLSIRQTLK